MNTSAALVDSVDFFRLDANRKLEPERRSDLGQFMTPPATARLMASMFQANHEEISLLDAGAGVGSPTAAFVSQLCSRSAPPKSISVTTYEIDPVLAQYLEGTLVQCRTTCEKAGVAFSCELIRRDFIEAGASILQQEMFEPARRFTAAILNPPYKKINSDSDTRRILREIGVETTNLYTGFLAVVLNLLSPTAELVAITPRSFCNGPYFRPFRKLLLDTLLLRRIHIFESRQVTFAEDDVLQENLIFCGEARGEGHNTENETVAISSSMGPEDDFATLRQVPYKQVVRTGDTEHFIHIVPDELGATIAAKMSSLPSTLPDLQIEVSTGRVVDFRAMRFLRENPSSGMVPLIYPRNLEKGFIQWPKAGGKKPQAMAMLPGADELLVAKGTYVLVKRFTAKEENRRVVAAVYDPTRIKAEQVGFENHTNYYHRRGARISPQLAKGLTAFLNSTIVDMFFRQFNGHTQVNATDLRNLRYPTAEQLEALGSQIANHFPDQDALDALVQKEIFTLADVKGVANPVKAKNKIDEALAILKVLDVPKEQQNERSALTLLSLLGLEPQEKWAAVKSPLMGITPMMDFFREHYGKEYAPNTRETVRRQTIHQFRDAGIVVANPDEPSRPVNSPKAVYQIEAGLLKLLKTYGTKDWEKGVKTYLASVETLKKKYAQERPCRKSH
jgi:adenine-specific DNA-methyltransferase